MNEIIKEIIIAIISFIMGGTTVYLTINKNIIKIKGNNNKIAGNDIYEN